MRDNRSRDDRCSDNQGISLTPEGNTLPSLASLPRQHGHSVGPWMTTRSRGRCAGNGPRTGLAPVAVRPVSPTGSGRLASTSAASASSSSSCSSSWASSRRLRSEAGPKRSRCSLAMSRRRRRLRDPDRHELNCRPGPGLRRGGSPPSVDHAGSDGVPRGDVLHADAGRSRLGQDTGAEACVVRTTPLAHDLDPLHRGCGRVPGGGVGGH